MPTLGSTRHWSKTGQNGTKLAVKTYFLPPTLGKRNEGELCYKRDVPLFIAWLSKLPKLIKFFAYFDLLFFQLYLFFALAAETVGNDVISRGWEWSS